MNWKILLSFEFFNLNILSYIFYFSVFFKLLIYKIYPYIIWVKILVKLNLENKDNYISFFVNL